MKRLHEALYLLAVASGGLVLNCVLLACILLRSRRLASAFIVHACALDIAKCIYCVPFATSLLRDAPPSLCATLGAAYVLVVTASAFNLLAMVCCEAYAFSGQHTGMTAVGGSLRCVCFGVAMVYLASIIIHLGPTVIGGDFDYNAPIGNCMFAYGTLKSYVIHTMWMAIITLAVGGAIYYLVTFQRHVLAHSTHRLATLVRASVAVARGVDADPRAVRHAVRTALGRVRTLFALVLLFVLCWYPLFLLTLTDPTFARPKKLYRLLTFVACSNAALNPIVFILFDRSISVCRHVACFQRQLGRAAGCLAVLRGRLGWAAAAAADDTAAASLPPRPAAGIREALYSQVGCRLCQQGEQHNSSHCNGGVRKQHTPCRQDSGIDTCTV